MEEYGREWLVTNGLGSYASCTVNGANTRHYHGLLVASFNPPTERMVTVGKMEERVFVNDEYFDLSTNQYPEKVHPTGAQFLKEFNVDSLPNWIYAADGWKLEKSIGMVQGSNITLVNYKNIGDQNLVLELHPLYAYCDYHTVFREDASFSFRAEISTNHLKAYAVNGAYPFFTKWSGGEYVEARSWYRNIQLLSSKERGLRDVCDFYRIGYVKKELKPNEQLLIGFSTEGNFPEKNLRALWTNEKRRSSKNLSNSNSIFYNDLLRSGNQFLVKRESTQRESIIAGYHWFTDWGRDTMIAMRGLTMATGLKAISKSVLSTFYKTIDKGMLPNRFPDKGTDIFYNTMDATLWLFIATHDYYLKFNDVKFIKEHLEALQEILDWHIKGTRYNIHVTQEGFLYGGEEGEQLTWMDAIVDGKVITPRMGCPVEINALWYNALRIFEFFHTEFKIPLDEKYTGLIQKFETNFSSNFINEQGTLYDVIIPGVSTENNFRPNQLFWLSLPYTILEKEQQKQVFDEIKEKLYTPYGLRTLDVTNEKFVGTYTGNQWHRDHAYHQGTVWPFLLFDYYHAFIKVYGNTEKNRKQIAKELTALKVHFYNSEGIHCISEVFDGLEPKKGKGCIQQAWSVSALIKLYTDYKLYELDTA